ncbi:helix-turn-helix domain-containing protein [Methylopila turkensis]|uniref:Transcriptional regulator n=1 Tax=Methylopila turkensis TaxID=1437816 RepID=A0A9W6JPW8_9HYPH|nr:helix-turn-helix transcriptional regulator [Methylopila turkensis]GLK80114.1 transcriptional regulator [Methylopila turkensis]
MKRTPPSPLREILARNVKELRAERGFSQDELAHRADVHRTYMSAVERRRRNVSLDVLHKIAAALGVAASLLLEDGATRDQETT